MMMKLRELIKLNQEQREIEYMRVLGLEEVDPIGILEKVLEEYVIEEEGVKGSIVLNFAVDLRDAVMRREEEIRAELDVEGGAE
jgi:hypothetical protein